MTLLVTLLSLLSDVALLGRAVSAALDSADLSAVPDTVSVTVEDADWAWVVPEAVRASLEARGVTVVLRGDVPTLSIKPGVARVSYTDKRGLLPWVPRKIARRASASLGIEAHDTSGALLVSAIANGTATDVIPADARDAVFVKGLSPQRAERGTSLAEALVSGVVLGGLLYTFYIFESR